MIKATVTRELPGLPSLQPLHHILSGAESILARLMRLSSKFGTVLPEEAGEAAAQSGASSAAASALTLLVRPLMQPMLRSGVTLLSSRHSRLPFLLRHSMVCLWRDGSLLCLWRDGTLLCLLCHSMCLTMA